MATVGSSCIRVLLKNIRVRNCIRNCNVATFVYKFEILSILPILTPDCLLNRAVPVDTPPSVDIDGVNSLSIYGKCAWAASSVVCRWTCAGPNYTNRIGAIQLTENAFEPLQFAMAQIMLATINHNWPAPWVKSFSGDCKSFLWWSVNCAKWYLRRCRIMECFVNHFIQINFILLTLAGAWQSPEGWLRSSGIEFPDLALKQFKIGTIGRIRGARNFSASRFRA